MRSCGEDIQEAVERGQEYSRERKSAGAPWDNKTADAIVRNPEIIGEAAGRLPPDFRDKHPAVEWAKITGLRHRIVHDYFGVDLDIIRRIVANDLPPFKAALEQIQNEFQGLD
ncbi:MAG: HepT-like ribonuclease domain-containing protein [Planctomycetota bacterium]